VLHWVDPSTPHDLSSYSYTDHISSGVIQFDEVPVAVFGVSASNRLLSLHPEVWWTTSPLVSR
jgi:hypothetical protein